MRIFTPYSQFSSIFVGHLKRTIIVIIKKLLRIRLVPKQDLDETEQTLTQDSEIRASLRLAELECQAAWPERVAVAQHHLRFTERIEQTRWEGFQPALIVPQG